MVHSDMFDIATHSCAIDSDVILESAVPTSGPVNGGTTVTLKGENFVSTEEILVQFASSGFVGNVSGTFISSSLLSCVAPAAIGPRSVDVTVALNSQQFTASSISFLYYVVPGTATIAPPSGPYNAQTPVQIIGTQFVDTQEITIRFQNGSNVAYANATFANSTSLSCVVPGFASAMFADVAIALNGLNYLTSAGTFQFYGMDFYVLQC